MKSFLALLKLQLLSRYANLKPKNLKAQIKDKKGRTVGLIIAYVIAIGYLGGFLIVSEHAILNIMDGMGMPDLLLSSAVMLVMLGTLIISFFFIMSALYLGRDAAFIAALPVSARTVLSAKLCQVWVSESGFAGLILISTAVQYGIRVGADAGFYLRALVVWLCAPVLPIVIVSFVSTVLIRLSALWKKRELFVTVGGILFLILYMVFAMSMGGAAGSGEPGEVVAQFVASNAARISSMTSLFPPAAWAVRGLQGDLGSLALLVAVCAAAAALAIWVLGIFYRNLSLLQTETPTASRKKAVKKSFAGGSAFKACCLREIRQILRVPAYATNSIPTSLMPVLMTGFMFVVANNAISQEGGSIVELLSGVGSTLVLPILTALMAYMAGMNPALATSVSREGRGHDFFTALPVSARTVAMSKMAVGYGMSLIGCLAASVLIMILLPAFALHAFLAFVLCALYTYVVCCLALARDIKHPKLDWVTEQEAIKQNTGALFNLLAGWGILIALGALTYLLLTLGLTMYPYAGIMLLLLGGCAFAAHRYLMKTADTQYCQG